MIKKYKNSIDLPYELVQQCRNLSYREFGLLYEYLAKSRKYKDLGYNGVISVCLSTSNVLLGWSGLFNWYDYATVDHSMYVYVRQSHRKLGLGRKLVKNSLSSVKEHETVAVHSSEGGGGQGFYESFNESRFIIQ